MVEEVTLDPHCENHPTPGHVLVNSEVAFLKSLSVGPYLFIQGESLSNWALEVGRARGWRITWLESPSLEVARICPGLTQEQAKQFLARLGSTHSLRRPLSIEEVATSLWPEISRDGKDDVFHAWHWLIWRSTIDLSQDDSLLASAYASYCKSQSTTPGLAAAYESASSEEAWGVIRRWLRCDGAEAALPQCPDQNLPAPVSARLDSDWRVEVVQTQGRFFERLLDAEAPRVVLTRAAAVCAAFYRSNLSMLTEAHILQLRPFLPFQLFQELSRTLPAADPGPVPGRLEDVCHWFTERYIPYRFKNRNRDSYEERVRSLALEFGVWCLRFYANAVAGGPGGTLLSWSRTAEVEGGSDSVHLLVVLDGLGFTDAQEATRFILDETLRLALDRSETVLSPLPTITRFAKPALIRGVSPAQAFADEDVGPVMTRDRDVIGALNASEPGAIIVWSLLEPDKTYHGHLDDQTLKSEVSGRLRSIARRLSRIVSDVRDSLKLRVVLTTDHGRLLSFSNRAIPVPKGMTAHGRAAWGPATVPFDRDGIYVSGEVAFLSGERFALPAGDHAAIVLSDATFLMADGRGGVESYPHGGAFPEEVLIPWVEFTRDRGPIRLNFVVTGGGVAGASGRIRLKIINGSHIQATVIQVAVPAMNLRAPTTVIVDSFKESEVEIVAPNWPAKKDLPGIEAAITYSLPAGDRQVVRVSATFTAEEMYTRDTTIDDLL